MVTPVNDMDGTLHMPQAECPVIAPPAVSAFVIRPSMTTSSAGPKPLSLILSVGVSPGPRTSPVVAAPDVYITYLNSLTHMVWIPPEPDGQDAAATGTPSPSDCYPAVPVGPCVAGGPVGPDYYLPALESGEHLVFLDHADPVGHHDADLDTAESLEYTVVENILDGRPMLEYSLRLLDVTLDGGLVERISEWTPVINPAISYTLDS